jgi:hypothetical protein
MKQLQMLKKGLDVLATAGLSMFCVIEAHAGFLSQSICRPYKKIVDDELFMWVTIVVATVIVIAAKLDGGKTALGKGLVLLACLGVALSIEAIVTSVTGRSIVCG